MRISERKINTVISGMFIALAVSAGGSSAFAGKEDTGRLLALLRKTAESASVIFGHQDDPVYGHSWVGEQGRSDVLETAGDYPGLMGWELGGIELGSPRNLDGVDFNLMIREAVSHAGRGGINTFSWHASDPFCHRGSWTVSDSTIVRRMVRTPEGKEAYRSQLRILADFFNGLRNNDGKKIAVIFRPWHEHTGNWFWWGAPFCTPQDYKELWRMMREEFDSLGVDNVVWAYSPDRFQGSASYLERYPGDEYVDILGVDIYHRDSEAGTEEFRNVVTDALSVISSLGREKGKPCALTETGQEGLTITGWFSDILLPLISDSGISYVMVWRNAHDVPTHFYAPWKGHPSESSFRKFTSCPRILMCRDLAGIKAGTE